MTEVCGVKSDKNRPNPGLIAQGIILRHFNATLGGTPLAV